MNLKERVYSILIVSAADSFTSALTDLLPKARYAPVSTVNSISAAKRALAETTYDFVIINAPLPDDIGVRFAIDTCTTQQNAVLIIVKNDLYASIHEKVVKYGVFTLPKPTPKPTLAQALSWMESARERLRQSEKNTLSIEDKMAEIRLVNRAKWILINDLKMSESDAHHYIVKQAMDCCLPKKSIAEDIIKTYSTATFYSTQKEPSRKQFS